MGWMVIIEWCQNMWRMTDATYKCADGADGGAGSAIGLGTISTLNLRVSTGHEFLVIALTRSLPGIISISKSEPPADSEFLSLLRISEFTQNF